MTPDQIKRALASRDMTLRGLSRAYGYAGVVFSYALRHPYVRVERLLSDFLQIPLHEIFPKRRRSDVDASHLKKCVYTIRENPQLALAVAGREVYEFFFSTSTEPVDKQKRIGDKRVPEPQNFQIRG